MPDFIITLRLRLVGRDGMKMEMETIIGCNGNGIKTTILQVGFIFNVNMIEWDIYIFYRLCIKLYLDTSSSGMPIPLYGEAWTGLRKRNGGRNGNSDSIQGHRACNYNFLRFSLS